MSASRCLGPALAQALKPFDRVAIQALIDAQPTVCPFDDCGEPRNCHERMKAQFNAWAAARKAKGR